MIDVIVPVYNNAATLEETLASVVRQSVFSEVRVLICDDCSSDSSPLLIDEWCKRFKNIKCWRNEVNLGVMGNYRKLASLSRAEFIAPMEGDDVWIATERLAILREYLTRSKSRFCFNKFLVRQGNNYTPGAEALGRRYRSVSAYELIEDNYAASFSNCFYRSEVFKDGLNKTATASGYDWLLNTLLAHFWDGMGFVPETLSSYYVSPSGKWSSISSAQKTALISKNLKEMQSLLPSLYWPSLEQKLARNESGR